jgi:DegV family protein with EDD domain
MVQTTAIVTDSLGCLTSELAAQYNVIVVPLSFMLLGKVYRDWVDIKPSQAYELFLKDPNSFQTSAPAPMEFLSAFREASQRAKNILCVTVSDKLSTTYNTASVAAEQAVFELPGTKIEIFNTKTAAAAEGLVALAAARAAAVGKDFEDVIKETRATAAKVKLIVVLDTIRHVFRSGRIPKIASQIGSVLHVKPILEVTPESGGLVRFAGVVRSRDNGVERILKTIKDEAGNNAIHIAVLHAYALEGAQQLERKVSASFNCKEIWLTEFSPLMGHAIGTGALGVAYCVE